MPNMIALQQPGVSCGRNDGSPPRGKASAGARKKLSALGAKTLRGQSNSTTQLMAVSEVGGQVVFARLLITAGGENLAPRAAGSGAGRMNCGIGEWCAKLCGGKLPKARRNRHNRPNLISSICERLPWDNQ